MLFGTWSQAHAYDPSNYINTRLKSYESQIRKQEHNCVITVLFDNSNFSQEIFAIDYDCLRSFRLYQDQA